MLSSSSAHTPHSLVAGWERGRGGREEAGNEVAGHSKGRVAAICSPLDQRLCCVHINCAATAVKYSGKLNLFITNCLSKLPFKIAFQNCTKMSDCSVCGQYISCS